MLSVLLLGAAAIGLGALLYLGTAAPAPAPDNALVGVRIEPPDKPLLFNGSVLLSADQANVLGALKRAAEIGNFSIDVSYSGMGAYVKSIDGIDGKGACGWVYEHNGIRAPRAADREVLHGEDRVLWHWGCEG
jgi:hypothetical protein